MYNIFYMYSFGSEIKRLTDRLSVGAIHVHVGLRAKFYWRIVFLARQSKESYRLYASKSTYAFNMLHASKVKMIASKNLGYTIFLFWTIAYKPTANKISTTSHRVGTYHRP